MFKQNSFRGDKGREKSDFSLFRIITLAPGHFHAALLQKSMYNEIDSTVYVFAPEGQEVKSHLALINEYNNAKENPTGWKEKVYIGPDYMDKMLETKPGNVVIIAGNNQMKTGYIKKSVREGMNVLADKPMAITKAGFDELIEAFAEAKTNKVLLYDMMTERYQITNILLKAFSQLPDVFGGLQKGTLESPAITAQSTHHFFKQVSGVPLMRPAWYFDVDQEGSGIVDVTTHLVDLIQWECFHDVNLDYKKDIKMITARHWATVLTPSHFRRVTQENAFPDFLKKDVKDNLLNVYANGEMNYTIKGVHVRVAVDWKFEADNGAGDAYYSMLRGTKASLIIRQGKEQHYKPILYIESVDKNNQNVLQQAIETGLNDIHKSYPGIGLKKNQEGWEVLVPDKHRIGHEEQFSLVFKKYLQYLREGKMPEWEISSMIAKYYTTTQALKKAMSLS